MTDSITTRLERIARVAENADHWTDVERLMPAAGVADTLWEACEHIEARRRVLNQWRMAAAGQVSVQSAIDMHDKLGDL